MKTKLSVLRRYMAMGAWDRALHLAAGWPRLGEHKARIERGWAALSRPDFYRELGHDVDALVADGITALQERYGE